MMKNNPFLNSNSQTNLLLKRNYQVFQPNPVYPSISTDRSYSEPKIEFLQKHNPFKREYKGNLVASRASNINSNDDVSPYAFHSAKQIKTSIAFNKLADDRWKHQYEQKQRQKLQCYGIEGLRYKNYSTNYGYNQQYQQKNYQSHHDIYQNKTRKTKTEHRIDENHNINQNQFSLNSMGYRHQSKPYIPFPHQNEDNHYQINMHYENQHHPGRQHDEYLPAQTSLGSIPHLKSVQALRNQNHYGLSSFRSPPKEECRNNDEIVQSQKYLSQNYENNPFRGSIPSMHYREDGRISNPNLYQSNMRMQRSKLDGPLHGNNFAMLDSQIYAQHEPRHDFKDKHSEYPNVLTLRGQYFFKIQI